jgi:hypothetical protein
MTAPERFADSQIPLAPRAPSIHDLLSSGLPHHSNKIGSLTSLPIRAPWTKGQNEFFDDFN